MAKSPGEVFRVGEVWVQRVYGIYSAKNGEALDYTTDLEQAKRWAVKHSKAGTSKGRKHGEEKSKG